MPKAEVPSEWDLGADPRYKRQNMEYAMRGQIERGLVELITNADDAYRDLEDEGKQVSGKIRIEIERRRKGQPKIVVVRDRAKGMSREEMYNRLGILGRRTSGFEKGKARRGLHGRGARDLAAFGTVHFESIKDGEYCHLVIPPSLKCYFDDSLGRKATPKMREALGIHKGNGTAVTIEVGSRFTVPQHDNLRDQLSRHYALRDLLLNPAREVSLVNTTTGQDDRLYYRHPAGEVVFSEPITIPHYSQARAHLVIHKHDSPFEQSSLPCREGILVKSQAAIHDCTYFGLDAEPFSWRCTGDVKCDFIDTLIREYDDREEANPDRPNHPGDNPMRLLNPVRDGLILEHPFPRELYGKCKAILRQFVEELKTAESPRKRDVADESLGKKLNRLSKEVSRIFERRMKELEEEIPPGDFRNGQIQELPLGLHIIPPNEHAIVVNQPKTFSVVVKHSEELDESLPVYVVTSDPDVQIRTSPVYFKRLLDDGRVGRTTFAVESSVVASEGFVEAHCGGYSNVVLVRTIDPPPPPDLPKGLSFDKPAYGIKINSEKQLTIWLNAAAEFDGRVVAQTSSSHPQIVVRGGGNTPLHETDGPRLLVGKCRIMGRELKAKGIITATVEGFAPAAAVVTVEEREPPGVGFAFDLVDDDFGSLRYMWDDMNPYLLKVGAKHPSIRKYLGDPTEHGYSGTASPLYHSVLAEVIAEALAFRVLELHFKREGQGGMLDYAATDSYFHKYFSEFLPVAHGILVADSSLDVPEKT